MTHVLAFQYLGSFLELWHDTKHKKHPHLDSMTYVPITEV